MFAAVGFIASIVTVADFLNSKSGPHLEVSVHTNQFRTPLYAAGSVQSNEHARIYVEEMRKISCSNQDQTFLQSITYEQLKQKFPDKAQQNLAYDCKLATEYEFAVRWSGEYSDKYSKMYEYKIENTGDEMSREIRIRASDLNSLQYARETNFIEMKKIKTPSSTSYQI